MCRSQVSTFAENRDIANSENFLPTNSFRAVSTTAVNSNTNLGVAASGVSQLIDDSGHVHIRLATIEQRSISGQIAARIEKSERRFLISH